MPKATIPIYHDDDFEKLADLRREVDVADRKVDAARQRALEAQFSARAGDDNPDDVRLAEAAAEKARDVFDAFVDEASERAEMWELKPIGHEEFRGLLKDHPPRKVIDDEGAEAPHPDDVHWGVNTESFPTALLLFVDPEDSEHRTVVGPKFDTEDLFVKRVRRLSDGEFDTMWTTALMANQGGVADPKSQRFSPTTPRSDGT